MTEGIYDIDTKAKRKPRTAKEMKEQLDAAKTTEYVEFPDLTFPTA